ncbi:MAG: chromate efflux transporter [Chthoniobacter sp.]|nr:chromate efflux transporter [Chthoniobacter sp.]
MDALPNTTMARQERARLREIVAVFLKLGATAFGGPAAHIAMMEEEVVRRRQWLTSGEFLDLVGATNLIPGPNSTELAIHIGHRRAGWAGLLVAGVCFILPAMLMVTVLAWAYVRFGRLPQVEGLLYGVKPVIIAIVVRALWPLACSAVRSRSLAVIGLTAAVLNLAGVNELLILFGAGAIVAAPRWLKQPGSNDSSTLNAAAPTLVLATATSAAGASTMAFGLGPLFLFFLKVGSVLFGSGYVLLAFLRADLVERWHWLSETQLLDAIAVGQITPGPVFTTATFIGYLLAGIPGASVATVGIFLPAFFFVAISEPLVPRLRRSAVAGAFLDGLNVASLALMAVVALRLAHAALIDWPTLALAAASACLIVCCRINSTWLVLGGAAIGCAVTMWR